jgi:hypothetical protein
MRALKLVTASNPIAEIQTETLPRAVNLRPRAAQHGQNDRGLFIFGDTSTTRTAASYRRFLATALHSQARSRYPGRLSPDGQPFAFAPYFHHEHFPGED